MYDLNFQMAMCALRTVAYFSRLCNEWNPQFPFCIQAILQQASAQVQRRIDTRLVTIPLPSPRSHEMELKRSRVQAELS